MTELQKLARFNLLLTLGGIPLLTFLSLLIFRKTISTELIAEKFTIWSYFVLIFAIGQIGRVFRKADDSKKILFDERDQFVSYRAIIHASYATIFILIIGLLLLLCRFWNPTNSIPFYVLPLCFSSIALTIAIVYYTSILIQYSRGGDDVGK
jgi:hypothetical protein